MNKFLISVLIGWIMFFATEIVSDFDMLNILLYNKYAKASDDRS